MRIVWRSRNRCPCRFYVGAHSFVNVEQKIVAVLTQMRLAVCSHCSPHAAVSTSLGDLSEPSQKLERLLRDANADVYLPRVCLYCTIVGRCSLHSTSKVMNETPVSRTIRHEVLETSSSNKYATPIIKVCSRAYLWEIIRTSYSTRW